MLNKSEIGWDNEKPSEEYWKELFRISTNQIIFGSNYFYLPPTRGMFCWNKDQPWDNFSQFELAWTSFDVPAKLLTFSNRGGTNAETKIHPTQKPVEVYEYLIKTYVNAGESIIDTHSGSNSLAIAVLRQNTINSLGLKLTSLEINKSYFCDSEKRIEDFIKEHSPAEHQPVSKNGQLKFI